MINDIKDGFIAVISAIEVVRLPFWEFQNETQVAVVAIVTGFIALVLIAYAEKKYDEWQKKHEAGKRQQKRIYTIDIDEKKITDVRRVDA